MLSAGQTAAHGVEWQDDEWRVNQKRCGRKQPLLNFMYCPKVWLERVEKKHANRVRAVGIPAEIRRKHFRNTSVFALASLNVTLSEVGCPI